MSMKQWAERWGIPAEAIADLARELNYQAAPDQKAISEAGVQSRIRLEASQKDILMWRNNVGALQDRGGRLVRFGLANDSEAVNDRLASADLIGCRRVLITPDMVGGVIGQFVSREIKKSDWRPGEEPEREAAQLAWATLLLAYGADACFACEVGTL